MLLHINQDGMSGVNGALLEKALQRFPSRAVLSPPFAGAARGVSWGGGCW